MNVILYRVEVHSIHEEDSFYVSEKEYEHLEQVLPFGKEQWIQMTDTSGNLYNYNRRYVVVIYLTKVEQ